MGARSILVALLGVSVAAGSAFGAREFLDRSRADASVDPASAFVDVIVASRDIPFGQPIQPQMLQVLSWPRVSLPPGAVTDINTLVAQPGMPPRRATHEISQGDFILASKVSEFGEKVTIVQNLTENTRAMAIRVQADTAVGGFVTPGDAVDIVLTQGAGEDLRALTILQNIRVVGVDQDANFQKDQPAVASTVTVEVSPEQSQTLALAQKAGTLSLSLRALGTVEDKPLDAIRLSDIMREQSPVAVEEAAKQTIRVRRGSEIETVEVK
ncbi:MAG: Flp pilus assembly protein CpaB [Rhodobacteraceae bacterium]|nr:Flp pilus assembly protein CpaB [Paracoccaceae bacterium]